MTKRALDSFLSISKEQGVTPLLVIMPAKYQLTPSLLENAGCDVSQLNVNESVDVLVSYARDKGVRFVDLLAYFRALSTDEQGQLFYQVDSHLTPYGSRKASEAIAEAIQ